MNNKKFYPYERNHYFFGKLLTVRDFDDEQRYVNDKRRLLNLFGIGPGVVSGLDVVGVDDKTISVEKGFAVDYLGREILVEESVLKKLNMIEGFDRIADEKNVYLCIDYDEVLKDEVHSVASQSDLQTGTAYNRVRETYRLFLTDTVPDENHLRLSRLVERKQVLYQGAGVKIEQVVPRYARSGEEMDIKIIVHKFHVTKPIEFAYTLASDYFHSIDGKAALTVRFSDPGGQPDRKTEFTVRVKVDNVRETEGSLRLMPESFSLNIGSASYAAERAVSYPVKIIDRPVRDEVFDAYFKLDMEDVLNSAYDLRIYLARLQIIRSDDSFIIEALEKLPFAQYACSNPLQSLLAGLEPTRVSAAPQGYVETAPAYEPAPNTPAIGFTQGTQIIDLEVNARNKTFFSDEIAHGLGVSPVIIQTAVEGDDKNRDAFQENMLFFGNPDIFGGTPYDKSAPRVETGVIAYPDRGTFRLGVRVLDTVKEKTITVHWWAYKPEDAKKDSAVNEIDRVTIRIEPSTQAILVREKFKFKAVVEGTADKECRWYVMTEDGGRIDYNGVYEAPSREGVYELAVESVKYPIKKASAFVVVKRS